MKFRMISAADVDAIREARKVLKRLQKRLGKMRTDAFSDTIKDYMKAADDYNRLLVELEELHVRSETNDDMSLEA